VPHPTGRPWIIAHRGASLVARENTLEAFLLARDHGADAVELDARRTSDGVVIVHHDEALAGEDRPIVAMTRSEVAVAAPWVPDLSDVVAACTGMWIDVEIKNDPREADWDPDDLVVASVAEAHAGADIVVTSFNPATVTTARAAGLRTGMLLGRGFDPAEMAAPAAEQGHEFLLPHWSTLDGDHGEHVVEAARRAGIEVAVWTVDDPGQMARLADLGVGAICTNAPDVAASALLENGHGERG
jgi:glycerophosphoryl diester phosphodiesterase